MTTTTKARRVKAIRKFLGAMSGSPPENGFTVDGASFTFGQLSAALGKLHKEDRTLLTRYFVRDETQETIAQECGISQPAVNLKIKEALSCLERNLFYGVEK